METIYFVVHARMPSPKAYGIHIAKMSEAFVSLGYHLTLVVPLRSSQEPLQEFYGLRTAVRVVRLPSLVFSEYGRLGFALMGASFVLSSLVYLWWKKVSGQKFWIYSADMDSFAHTLLPLAGPTVAEFHSPKPSTFLQRFFFRRAHGIVAANPLIAQELKKTFGTDSLVEPNGADMHEPLPARDEARQRLGIPQEECMALYVGRFYKWKGLEILPASQRTFASRDVVFRVLGGTKEEFEEVFGDGGELRFASAKLSDVPLWLAAADVLLVIGTSRDEYSYRYTTPMKVFEYLAAGRPVVASDTPALRSFVPEDVVSYCPPDDPEALARAVRRAVAKPDPSRIQKGRALAARHTWSARTTRIAGVYIDR